MKDSSEPKLNYVTLLEQQMPNGITRKLEARQAFDLRKHPRNYGIADLGLWWAVKRGDCAVTWRQFTGWYLKANREGVHSHIGLGSIDYHSPIELYPDQYQTSRECEHIGCPCYSDGTSLIEEEFERFLADPASLWSELERRLEELEERVLAARENAKAL